MNLNRHLSDLIKLCEIEINKPNAYPYLPEIIETLIAMHGSLNCQHRDATTEERLLRGLGRLVTEDLSFSEGDLGRKILAIISQYEAR